MAKKWQRLVPDFTCKVPIRVVKKGQRLVPDFTCKIPIRVVKKGQRLVPDFSCMGMMQSPKSLIRVV